MGTKRKLELKLKRTPSLASQFPDDVLRQIFLQMTDTRSLCYASEVCRQWHRVSMSDRTLWKRLRLSKPYSSNFTGKKRKFKQEERALVGIARAIEVMTTRASGCLTELDFEHVVAAPRGPKAADMLKIKDRSKDTLEVLKLHGEFNLSSSVFLDVISACTKLRVLHTPNSTSMRLTVFRKILRKCRRLEDINLDHCEHFRCDTLALGEALTPVCETLRKINFSFTNISGLPLWRFGRDFPKLEEIHADACLSMSQTFPRQEGVFADNGFFPNLTTFSVNGARSFPAEWVRAIFNAEWKLHYFTMNFSPFSDLDLVFAGHLPCLTVLGLAGQGLTDDLWQKIFNNLCPTLEICDLRLNRKLTGALSTEALGGRTFSQLVSLDFCDTSISDEGVRQILQLAPKLETFRLHGCRGVLNRQLRRNPLGQKTANTSRTEADSRNLSFCL